MKTNNVLFLASILAAGFSASMQAGSHHSNSASTAVAAPAPAPAHGAGPALHSGSGNFRYGGGPMISPSQRFSSYRGPVAGQRRFAPGAVTGSYNPARFTSARSRNPGTARSNAFTSNRNGTRGLANATNNHVFARHSASW
ncbi:MAG: hypothetical protein QOH24_173, partial [Verrucomicrobiota bacterium]